MWNRRLSFGLCSDLAGQLHASAVQVVRSQSPADLSVQLDVPDAAANTVYPGVSLTLRTPGYLHSRLRFSTSRPPDLCILLTESTRTQRDAHPTPPQSVLLHAHPYAHPPMTADPGFNVLSPIGHGEWTHETRWSGLRRRHHSTHAPRPNKISVGAHLCLHIVVVCIRQVSPFALRHVLHFLFKTLVEYIF